ncbi:MAG: glutamine--tRNA ligase [Gemmatimonadetes bacterium]|nr:glutamine--tRNA ligase [Gemmatimonadota bacterium]
MAEAKNAPEARETQNFIEVAVASDRAAGRFDGRVHTRFPPEPNGFLHIGHAKAICLGFSLAETNEGLTNLRFDDTNPIKEESKYVEAITEDVRWLGYEWGDRLYYASDYFEQLYEWAVKLIEAGKAFVCDLSAEEIRAHRGTLTEPGIESPFRNRSVDENLDLFERMRGGEFEDGSRTLRAKIDMASGNLNLRDPVMYRVLHTSHHRSGDQWCIYPTYDWAHGQSDSIEGITHSTCTLEFENHRPLYDWYLDALGVHHPRQIEFAPLNLSNTILSKRKLLQLVNDGHVSGWDDPRMPTLSGMRRRGFPPTSIRTFCGMIGVGKQASLIELAQLEFCVREDLNRTALRRSAVLRPLKVVIENYPEEQEEKLEAINNPEDDAAGTRKVPFSRELYIERSDFMEDPPKKYFRLGPGREVRLRYGYFIRCVGFEKDERTGDVVELRCTYDPETRGGHAPDGRKVKGTIHWVSARHAIEATVRLYNSLFACPDPGALGDAFLGALNPDSVETIHGARVEPSLAEAEVGLPYQFERQGYYCKDSVESKRGALVFNRTVSLRDSWAKIVKKARASRR